MFPRKSAVQTALSCLILSLAGCGGGGGGGGASSTPSSQTTPTPVATSSSTTSSVGAFVDSAVQGLTVKHADGSTATTGSNGQFAYTAGETLSIYLGNLKLADVKGQSLVTPLTLFNTSNLTDVRVVNLLRLLQTLDTDSDPSNGITLSATTLASASAAISALDLTKATTDFEVSSEVQAILAAQKSGLTLVPASAASSHFAQTLSNVSSRGVYAGTVQLAGGGTFDVAGTSSAVFLFSGRYTAANGKTYSIGLSAPVAGKADLQITGTQSTSTSAGPISVPQLTTDSGTVTISGDALTFTGSGGNVLTLTRSTAPAAFAQSSFYSSTTQATVCANGNFTLIVPIGYGLPAAQYSGLIHPGATGLRYALASTLSFGSAQFQIGDVTVTPNAVTFSLPGGSLTLPLSATGTSLSGC